jgi:hypothetical protein
VDDVFNTPFFCGLDWIADLLDESSVVVSRQSLIDIVFVLSLMLDSVGIDDWILNGTAHFAPPSSN